MIKMIVSDMDGTLVKKGEDCLSGGILRNIELIKEKGILFAIASGRHYKELLRMTKGIKDIYYICSDGGCIIYNNEVIYINEIDKFYLNKLNEKENIFFHTPFEVKKRYCEDDSVIKVSAFGGGFFELPSGTYEVYRDKEWREWIKNGCGKGQSVRFLQNINSISVKETAAFGDNFNDMSMFRCAGMRYCMNKAPAQVKMLCDKHIDDIEKGLNEIGGI